MTGLFFSCAAAETTFADQQLRPWRIVVNDDGDFEAPGDDPDLQKFLDRRFSATVATQVDAYFLNIASTDRLWDKAKARPQDAMSQWAAHGDVPGHVDRGIRRYIDAAHAAGMEIFLAVRLNDIHDAWHETLTYPLKVQRPDLLLGRKGSAPDNALMRGHWSGLDWSSPVVRDHFREFLLWAAARWDFDGVELDWFRHPLFFRLGEAQENIPNMTDFVRQMRAGLGAIGDARGKRYLMTTRVPDSPRLALATGFDVEQWLKEGLLDMLMVGGGYMPYGGRVKEFIDMAHRYGVHAYPCMNHFKDPQIMRSVAANFWALGADGFYLFNWGGAEPGDKRLPTLHEMGSPATLAGRNKRFLADTGCSVIYVGHTNPVSQFPRRVVGGAPIELVVGDDVTSADVLSASLIVTVTGLDETEGIVLQINGQPLPGSRVARFGAEAFHADVAGTPMVHGINKINVGPGSGSLGRLDAHVTGVELLVKYE